MRESDPLLTREGLEADLNGVSSALRKPKDFVLKELQERIRTLENQNEELRLENQNLRIEYERLFERHKTLGKNITELTFSGRR